jgi:hypothetical protein
MRAVPVWRCLRHATQMSKVERDYVAPVLRVTWSANWIPLMDGIISVPSGHSD